ncbi:ketopantoate reductase family protein [Rhizobium binae]|uniref:ketopantoate reductase family protein n=1 Tax=Rhizobium binae TaxID=1138190 RepID=UPI001C832ABB|nr:2-dehydropantoate 2-reductase [Rhizobium binae]MBX4967737.1 2-dehydropantoate 2-reductase [Rhizobium binae]
MLIVVLGAGAMGCLFGATLAKAGYRVQLIDIDPVQIAAIESDGICICGNADQLHVRVPISNPDGAVEIADWVVVLTKTLNTRSALESVRHILGPTTRLVSLQNGLGNAEELAQFAPSSRVVVGVTTIAADLIEPGRVYSNRDGSVRLNTILPGDPSVLCQFVESLRKASFHCVVDANVQSAIWHKTAFNSALNSLCAVTRLPVGDIGLDFNGRRLAHLIADEVLAVADILGVPVSKDEVRSSLDHAMDYARSHKPSMLQDILAGRPTEIESINGAVVRIARALNVAIPATEALYTLVRLLQPREVVTDDRASGEAKIDLYHA